MTAAEYKALLIKRVHCCDKYKEIYRDDRLSWEDMLRENYGVASSKSLSIDDLKDLLAFLEGKTCRSTNIETKVCGAVTAKQWSYIQTIRGRIGMDDKYFRNVLKKICGVDHERFLDVPLARKLITAMLKTEAWYAKKNMRKWG